MLRRPDSLQPDAVFFAPDEDDWVLRADCPHCAGYQLALRVRDPDKRLLAEVRASAFLEGIHSASCLGCHAVARRNGELDPASELDVWWDPSAGEWMAPLNGAPGAAMPLGVRSYWARQEARAAARALRDSGPLPLRVAAEPSELDRDSCTVFYDTSSGRWHLRVGGCFDCEGFQLRLAALGRGNLETACAEALRCLDRVAEEGCPHCRSQREREGTWDTSDEPRLWYDTTQSEWVVWRPIGGPGNGITLPLEIARYDADEGQLLRAASDALFGGRHWLDLDGEGI
jgi:hypothetical protein